jgi:DivIVA domain-containing protein
MELTPKVFRDVQFREKLRGGYHPEDVDEFLEQAAVAAEELLERLQRAEARAQRAEQSLEDASANDETLKRVLVMAQRTADQAVREAREEAERLLAEARVQAQTIIAEAEERGRRAYDAKIADSTASLDRAEAALRRAQSDAEALSRWVEVNRAHLLEALREAASFVEKVGFVEEPPSDRSAAHFGGQGQPAGGASLQEDLSGGSEAARASGAEAGGGDAPAISSPASAAQSASAGNSPATSASSAASPGGSPATSASSAASPGGSPATSASSAASPGGSPATSASSAASPGGSPATSGSAEWDPHFLDNLEEDPPLGIGHTHGAAQPGEDTQPGTQPATDSGHLGWDQPGGGRRPEAAEESTVAFDERALENFFSDQDLGPERGSRFRRRG